MKWKDILFVLGLSAVLGACEKKDIEVFTTDDAGIYFQLIKGYYGTTTEFTRIHLIIHLHHFRPR